jgi:hypothetical protein
VSSIRKWIVVGTSFGAGCALMLAAVYGIWTWHQTRPKTWNSNAIVATLDRIEIDSTQDRLIFNYVLHNRTRTDYRLSGKDQVDFMTRLKDPPSLMLDDLADKPANFVQMTRLENLPLFIPAGESVWFSVSCFNPFRKGSLCLRAVIGRPTNARLPELLVGK